MGLTSPSTIATDPATRLYVEGIPALGAVFDLPESAVRHLQARRLRVGDELTLFDGQGGEYRAHVVELGRRSASVQINQHIDIERESTLAITILQGVSKGERMDFAVQKATELGATRFIPVITDRCVVKLNASRWAKKQRHWQAVAASASEQCGRNRVPIIEATQTLSAAREALTREPNLTGLVLDTEGDRRLSDIPPSDTMAVLIGPEGGLSDAEIAAMAAVGWQRVRFGPRILRNETATLAAVTALQLLNGDLR